MSTQQTSDFLENFDCDDYVPKLDNKFELILSQVDHPLGKPCSKEPPALAPVSSAAYTPITASYCLTSATTTATGTTTQTTATFSRIYSSPKSTEAVNAAKSGSIPAKTKEQTEWAVRTWKEWALCRNSRLLSGEQPFSPTFTELSVPEMNFWLSKFVLEVRKKNGEPYPPNTLYQLICGLQCQLREHGRADIN